MTNAEHAEKLGSLSTLLSTASNDLPFDDFNKLEALLLRTRVTITNIFGEKSQYLGELKRISFSSGVFSLGGGRNIAEDKEAWEAGKILFQNLCKVMIEELNSFFFREVRNSLQTKTPAANKTSSNAALVDKFKILTTENPGIESLVTEGADDAIFQRLGSLESEPLSKVQLNQLLGLSKEKGVSDGFFKYYWLSYPSTTYDLKVIPGYSPGFQRYEQIISLEHLLWGLHRIYIDGLLFRGNVRAFYREFASLPYSDIDSFVSRVRVDTAAIKHRGPTLPFHTISKDNRYLISEMACKSYGATPETASELKAVLLEAWKQHQSTSGASITIRALLEGDFVMKKYLNQSQLKFSADDILDQVVESETDIETRYGEVARAFTAARDAALRNTKLYLSLVNDLDVYVATSMRTREDFRKMATTCDEVFQNGKLADLHLRYFDPTLSAAEGHQDKGLIECLMVKCAKVLVYCAGEKESYGKDAEAAMALSLGKPVIFLCDEQKKESFYRDVHPLSRLINFQTGVAVGAMVASKASDVSELLDRIFENEMQYEVVQPKPSYLQLKEKLTGSVVRLQTSDKLLAEAFWNYYKSQH